MNPATKRVKKVRQKRVVEPPFPEHGHNCLNCGHELSGNYCMTCGQPTSTHRLSILHFIMHDLVHSLWHVDRGIFFTLKEVIVRPGYAALEFIRGRRAGRFPILTLLLLLLGLSAWISSFMPHGKLNALIKPEGQKTGELLRQLVDFIKHNLKWILLSIMPVISLSSRTIFRRTRFNYTEHLLINSYIFGGYLAVMVMFKLIALSIPSIADFIDDKNYMLVLLFFLFGYWQAYHKAYTVYSFIRRCVILLLLNIVLFILIIIIALIVGYIALYIFKPELLKQLQHQHLEVNI